LFCFFFFIFINKNKEKKTEQDSSESQDVCIGKQKIQEISVHVPRHRKPESDNEFGHYLAGLIDGKGFFSKNKAHIKFNSLDASLAYYIKKRIGYGSVTKVKSKDTYLFTITKREGLQIFLNFINGKLRTQSKCDDVFNYILNISRGPLSLQEKFHINNSKYLDNY